MSKPLVNQLPQREPVKSMGIKQSPYLARTAVYLPPMTGSARSGTFPLGRVFKAIGQGVVVTAVIVVALFGLMVVSG